MPLQPLLTIATALSSLSMVQGGTFQPPHHPSPKNHIAGTWHLSTANINTNGTTTPAFGNNPTGILIFAPTLYFSELVTIDPAHRPHFASNYTRTTGTAEQNAEVIADTLAQIGTYTVDKDGLFESEVILASTFPNWDGLYRNISSINETLSDGGRYMHETLHDPGSNYTVRILWVREEGYSGSGRHSGK